MADQFTVNDLTPQTSQMGGMFARLPERRDPVQGLVFHHTTAGKNPDGSIRYPSVEQSLKGFGVRYPVSYIMDRDGSVYKVLRDDQVGYHIDRPSKYETTANANLSNGNTIGIEMISGGNEDLSPQQIAAGQKFAAWAQKTYPGIGNNIYGHEELNPGHRQMSEGMGVILPFRSYAGLPGQKPNAQAIQQAVSNPPIWRPLSEKEAMRAQPKLQDQMAALRAGQAPNLFKGEMMGGGQPTAVAQAPAQAPVQKFTPAPALTADAIKIPSMPTAKLPAQPAVPAQASAYAPAPAINQFALPGKGQFNNENGVAVPAAVGSAQPSLANKGAMGAWQGPPAPPAQAPAQAPALRGAMNPEPSNYERFRGFLDKLAPIQPAQGGPDIPPAPPGGYPQPGDKKVNSAVKTRADLNDMLGRMGGGQFTSFVDPETTGSIPQQQPFPKPLSLNDYDLQRGPPTQGPLATPAPVNPMGGAAMGGTPVQPLEPPALRGTIEPQYDARDPVRMPAPTPAPAPAQARGFVELNGTPPDAPFNKPTGSGKNLYQAAQPFGVGPDDPLQGFDRSPVSNAEVARLSKMLDSTPMVGSGQPYNGYTPAPVQTQAPQAPAQAPVIPGMKPGLTGKVGDLFQKIQANGGAPQYASLNTKNLGSVLGGPEDYAPASQKKAFDLNGPAPYTTATAISGPSGVGERFNPSGPTAWFPENEYLKKAQGTQPQPSPTAPLTQQQPGYAPQQAQQGGQNPWGGGFIQWAAEHLGIKDPEMIAPRTEAYDPISKITPQQPQAQMGPWQGPLMPGQQWNGIQPDNSIQAGSGFNAFISGLFG